MFYLKNHDLPHLVGPVTKQTECPLIFSEYIFLKEYIKCVIAWSNFGVLNKGHLKSDNFDERFISVAEMFVRGSRKSIGLALSLGSSPYDYKAERSAVLKNLLSFFLNYLKYRSIGGIY